MQLASQDSPVIQNKDTALALESAIVFFFSAGYLHSDD